MAKIYHVNLTGSERAQLLEFIKRGDQTARKINRASILLLAHEGKTDRDIAETLHTSVPTVQRTRQRFAEGGLDGALNERPRPGGRMRRKLDEKGVAILERMARSEPPEGRKHWTMQLLADRLIEVKVVDSISSETVRKELKKSGLRLE